MTSGGYAHYVKKSIALGYVLNEFAEDKTELKIEINGNLYTAHIIEKCLYDPSGIKMRE